MIAVRLDPGIERALSAVARRQRRTRSDVIREAIRRYLSAGDLVVEEARRQSRRVSRTRSEREAVRFIAAATDVGDDGA